MSYLSVSDRMSAGLVNQHWHEASLDSRFVDKQAVILNRQGAADNLQEVLNILQNSVRPFYHFIFNEMELRRTMPFWEQYGPDMRSLILVCCDLSERTLVAILNYCESLRKLHINACRECLMSGRLLDDENDVKELSSKFQSLHELSLASNRYLSDALFNRLVAICPNLDSLSLMGCQISFHVGLYKKFYPDNGFRIQASESVLTFPNVLRYITQQSKRLKHLNFGCTLIDGTALASLSTLKDLKLESLKLHACEQLTYTGIRTLLEHQTTLRVLDVSFCTRVTDISLICICKSLKNLEVLNIRRCRAVTAHGIREIRNLEKLKELDISECEQLTGECITDGLCSIKIDTDSGNSDPNEDSENVNPNSFNVTSNFSDNKQPLNRNLERFSANALNLDEKSIELIAMSFPKLRLLGVGYCFSAVTDKTIQTIFEKLILLRSLKISRCDKVSDLGLTGMGAGNKENIKKVMIVNTQQVPRSNLRISLRSRAEEEIVRDAKRKNEVMQMCGDLITSLDDEHCSGFSLTRLRGLTELNLAGCNRITDVSLKYAFTFPELRILDLSMCQQVTHVGLDFLTKNNPAIEDLNLSQCHNLTDTGISYVAKRLRRLKRVHLQSCSRLTDHSLDSIKLYCNSLKYLDVRCCQGMSMAGIENLCHLHVEYTKHSDVIMHNKVPPPAPPIRR
ncbi:F-box/LRR-repeat protein 4 isoform X2 [Cephus cinctus]|nr:F-box/LRR-repeat protein 4 isoform X2 [Cephus cinctus]